MTSPLARQSHRKKQLGQYFTGRPVGRLLAALADAENAQSIIDPMVGSADLLAACLEVGARPETLVGYDLDPLAIEQARIVLEGEPGVRLEAADAFSAVLPDEQFDLVITNPPYIRYQSKGEIDGLSIPSAVTVRKHLIQQINNRSAFSEIGRTLFAEAAQTYPGTSDVAVPAWILSAALVREGGILAVVAPQSWLSRDYAQPVRQLLGRAFDIEAVIEDGDASWFNDALVRTHLVVARRRIEGAAKSTSTVVARATKHLSTRGSLLGTRKSEQSVARALRQVSSPVMVDVTRGLQAKVSEDIFLAVNGDEKSTSRQLASAVGSPDTASFRTLASFGWSVGQGLRTGANDFFYLTAIEGRMRPSTRWGIASLDVPPECLEPAVWRQSDLNGHFDVSEAASLPSRIVNLRGWVTTNDARRTGASENILPAQVSKWITRVGKSPLTDTDPSRTFPKLAAVATNVKRDRDGQEVAFWYQLPQFAPRHRPKLFIPRVCGGRPRTYSNSAEVLVDANFATMWPVSENALSAEALFALLNSAWAWASLEVSSPVLGGGALKVEATGLRRLSFPDLNELAQRELSRLGERLRVAGDESVLVEIDKIVASILSDGNNVAEVAAKISAVATKACQDRSKQ